MKLNLFIFFQIQKLKGKIWGLNHLMIFGAEAVIYITLALMGVLAITTSGIYRQSFISSIIAIPLSLIIVLLIHIFIKEKRPYIKFGFTPLVKFYRNLSFPSTHTTIMTILALSSLYYHTNLAIPLLILLLWVAIARIYIGVHFPIDILGGFITGLISLSLVVFAALIKNSLI